MHLGKFLCNCNKPDEDRHGKTLQLRRDHASCGTLWKTTPLRTEEVTGDLPRKLDLSP